ncbi:DUF4274 domain-containing protein [Croceibacter atlanticus]|uniref:DUF4274 domain-containing protein n=1 Tax=Croceibacter atlanticus TaxID=313588 RepID=UPI002E15C7D9|nr:DUF4274 domain-containing protein [Croceibacter atlanticus]
MIVRPHKVFLINKNFIEFSFNESAEDIIPDFSKFKSLNSAEQFYLADRYNWDDGAFVLQWIIDSPKCDKGTACKIFWSAEPDYYFDYTENTIDESEKDIWLLLQSILKRFHSNNFKTNKFQFIPSQEGYKTSWPIKLDIWKIPKELKNGIKGKKPFSFGL